MKNKDNKNKDDKNKNYKKRNDKKSYSKFVLITVIFLLICYVIVYFCFKDSGFIPSGEGLDKKDWLAFLGSYLSFSGTILVSLIAVLQTYYYAKRDNEDKKTERKRQIKPVFSVDIVSVNEQIPGTAEAFNMYQQVTIPKHENVQLKIENVSAYPIRHIIIFNKYLWQMLKPNEAKTFCVAYSNSIDAQKYNKGLIPILENEFEPNENRIPTWFNINYEDIDGNDLYQTFELKLFEDTIYYSLKEYNEV